MIGVFRLALSIFVMASHIGPTDSFAVSLKIGAASVWCFYALSGYLMVSLTQGPYRGRRWAFLASRAARIYPTYWAVLILALAGMWLFATPEFYAEWISRPTNLVQNFLLLINLDGVLYGVPVHVAWTLTAMLFWWVAIAFGIFDQKFQTYVLLGVAIVCDRLLSPTYISIQWAFIPFAVGASLYWLELKIPMDNRWESVAGAISYPLFLVHYPVAAFLGFSMGWGRSWLLFFAALLPAITLSLLLWRFVEVPINNFRKTLKTQEA